MTAPLPQRAVPALGARRVALAWLVGVLVARVIATGAGMVAILFQGTVPGFGLYAALTVAGVVAGLVGVLMAVLSFSLPPGRAAGRPLWHWVVAGVPVLVVGTVVDVLVTLASTGHVYLDVERVAVLAVELVLGTGLALGVGAVLQRSAAGRTPVMGTTAPH
ncbi:MULTISPECIES: hypothetical protein [unclassified Actinotalea]|uniref:hypothetical protein n=1 Tax=unclassified Actinotalea TaxID=2638618 RepID=UPI0015F6BE71|nr:MULTISPECIES: hypothetical protein [unclassified Actinotalea]